MPDVIVAATDKVFDASQWICMDKIYKNVPIEVADACSDAREFPPFLKATLPRPDLSITEFIAMKLPEILKGHKTMLKHTEDWFSTDLPNCDPITTLWSLNSIPPHSFLCELENDFPQKWLNGAKSIVDPLDRSLRLPLFALPFYRKIHDFRVAQAKWTTSVEWVRDEVPGSNLEVFTSVSWNAVHPGAPDGQIDWTRLLDDEWVSDGIIDNMMAEIQDRVAEIPALASTVTVAPLSFQRAILAISKQKHPSPYTVRLLKEYKLSVEAGRSHLYFPLHVNGNHWIAFFIDFARKVFGYGDSYGRKSSAREFIPHLKKWLCSFPGTFEDLGDVLPHPRQIDYVHCGIYATNTFQNKLFQTPLISLADCRKVRMDWFLIFVQRASSDSIAAPLLSNYNFPDLGPENFFEDDVPPLPAPIVVATPPEPPIVELPLKRQSVCSSFESDEKSEAPAAPANPPDVPAESTGASHPPKNTKGLSSKRKANQIEDSESSDADDSDKESRRRKLLTGNKRTKELPHRKAKTDSATRRRILEQDPHTVKLPSGQLKGTPHEVFCQCKPVRVRKLDTVKEYHLKNWESHQKTCELVTRVKPGARTQTLTAPEVQKNSNGIGSFFQPIARSKPAQLLPPQVLATPPARIKKVIAADTRLDSNYFSGAGQWPTRMPPPVLVLEEVECLGLHGDGYREYTWQRGVCYIGGISATEWSCFAHTLFPYKDWYNAAESEPDSDVPDIPDAAAMPGKAIHAACLLTAAVELAMNGIKEETNTLTSRALWTDYEKKRLHQSLVVASRWSTQPNTGSVYAKDCRSVTTNLTGTCSACTALASLPGLQQAVRRARIKAKLSTAEFTAKWRQKQKFTPKILNDSSAADVKTYLSNPAVLKILSSKAMHGPGGAFLALYQQAQLGDLDDKESFVAICNQFTDRVKREKDPSGRAMKGIRYSPELGQLAALMRSHGPRSGVQYDLFKNMVGGISQRQLRRHIAKSAMKMVSWELCAGNLEAAVEFGRLMKYLGPWICAGDGTKLRPLLSTSTEFSGPKSAHVVGSTFPLSQVLFESSEAQSRIISEIDAAKAIATQVWVLAITIPLPNMPVFPVAFIPNQGKMKAPDYCEQHLNLRQLCADAGIKLLASAADGAKSEVNAQLLMMNAKTKKRLTYENPFYGVHMSCPVYEDTGPHIACTDMEHAKKGVRNNFLYGTHLLTIGFLYLCHAVLMMLLSKVGVPLFIRDIFNPEKQDDGAARRLFLDRLFAFLVDPDGNIIDVTFEGFFVLTFIFGELFDAYMKRGMPHIERVTCIFRARHFLNIWRANIVQSESRYPDLFQKQSSFLADATFQILIRLCDQFILLILAHLEYYPDVPFLPRKHGSGFIEHFFGITRSFIEEFTFAQLLQMNKHITFRQRILSSGKFNNKKEKDSNNGYIHDCDSPLTAEEISALKQLPSRQDLDRACAVAWEEAAALASQYCGMEIPELPLKSGDLHPHFRTANSSPSPDEDTDSESETDTEEGYPVSAKDVDFELDTIRNPPHPVQDAVPLESDASKLGMDLTVSQALAHAAHHIVTESYLADLVAKDEAELEAIDKELDANPDTPVSGRMQIAHLLNPAPAKPAAPPAIPTFLKNGKISRQDLIEQRRRHCATTRVNSEKTRKPEINVEYLGGKFSLNHAAHQLKEGIQLSEGLRNDTTFQKARYRRWIVTGPAVEWREGCRLDIAVSELHVPKLRSRGVDALTPIRLGSLVVMRTAIRLYLGEVLGIYRYGSVSGKHESYTDAETVDGLSYLSLRVYDQLGPRRNIFQHMAPPQRSGGRSLALFTHAPISELVYLLTGAKLSKFAEESEEMYSISAGDSGWERWDALNSNATVYRILNVGDSTNDSEDEDEDDYEEPDEGSSSKKRRPKAPRGAAKKQKKDTGPKQKPRKNAVVPKKAANKERGAKPKRGGKE
ncbi:hypothetical protein C8R44DRAFT_894034 [Mycena epipterygia]|nr:hypothetical protein C8R44DRAFT_894034 [Mycena epipterygia]